MACVLLPCLHNTNKSGFGVTDYHDDELKRRVWKMLTARGNHTERFQKPDRRVWAIKIAALENILGQATLIWHFCYALMEVFQALLQQEKRLHLTHHQHTIELCAQPEKWTLKPQQSLFNTYFHIVCGTTYPHKAAAHVGIGHRKVWLGDGLFEGKIYDSFQSLLSVNSQFRHLFH